MSGIGIVSVHYYREYLQRSLASVTDLADRANARALIVVANRPDLLPELQQRTRQIGTDRVQVRLHSNTGLEFGAYDAGLQEILAADPDWVIFANDTYSVHHCFPTVYRKHLLFTLTHVTDRKMPRAVGQVEFMPQSYSIGGKRTHRWLTTSIFALNRPALDVLGNRVYFPDIDLLVRASGVVQEFFAPSLDPVLADHIGTWLFGGARKTWYGAAPLTSANGAKLANKARAILQEKYISAMLDEAGTWFFDVKGSDVRETMLRRVEAVLFSMRPTPTRRSARALGES